jgi:hypothetical protein
MMTGKMGYFFAILFAFLPCGCGTIDPDDPFVVKLGHTYPYAIENPYDWSRRQIREAAPIDQDGALMQAKADLDGDESPELFIRADVPASTHLVLVFRRDVDGWHYIGSLPGSRFTVIRPNVVRIYYPLGGINAVVYEYVQKHGCFHDTGNSLPLNMDETDPGNDIRRAEELFKREHAYEWSKVVDSSPPPG